MVHFARHISICSSRIYIFPCDPGNVRGKFCKDFKIGLSFTAMEAAMLLVGCLVAFVVSVIAIKFLMGYIKKNDFKVFGYYRIILGALVLLYFTVFA